MDSTSTANSGGSATGGLLSKADWKPDQSSLECNGCQLPFTIIRRRHHCRMCGSIFCDACSSFYSILPSEYGYSGQQRLCKSCNNSFEQKRQYYETDSLVARFQLRSTAEFEYIKALQDIGNTKNGLRKSYGMAKNSSSGGDECIVSIITPNSLTCPWSMTNEKKKRKFEKTLLSLKHPYIMTPLKVEVSGANDKILIIRSFNKCGSLRDLIYKSKPLSPFDTKYNNIKNSKASTSITSTCLPVKSIQKYCKQILESLLYLKSKGIQFIHIHCSNVLIVNDNCQLIDIENNLLGMKSYYNEYLPNNNVNQEVICFGHLLFEMIVGIPLGDHSNINSFIPLFPDKVFLILQQIFNTDKPTPSLEELVKNNWFEVTTTIEQQSSLSTNGKLKKSQLAFIKDTSGKFEQPKANLSNSFSSGNINKLSTSNSSNTTTTTTTNSGTKNNKLNNSFGSSGGSNSFSPSSPTSNTVSPNSSYISSPPKNPIFQTFTPPTQTPTKSPSAPPPPPPPSSSGLRTSNSSNPPPSSSSTSRNSLLDSIRNPDNMKKLKKQTTNTNKSKSTIGPGSLKPSTLKKK